MLWRSSRCNFCRYRYQRRRFVLLTSSSSMSINSGTVRNSNARPSSSSSRHLHHEDLLLRTWRSIAHSAANVTNKAEKAVTDLTNRELHKELNEATIGFLRIYMEWRRSVSYLQAKLEGRAAELEAIEYFVRSTPSLGRKRKRLDSSTTDRRKGIADLTPSTSSA